MNKYSTTIYNSLIERFPDFNIKNDEDSNNLEVNIPSTTNAPIGGIVIQTTSENAIWIRNHQPYSVYSVDTIQELINILEGLFEDRILWAIGYKNEVWVETTLCNNIDNLEREEGVTYKLLSWSGTLDEEFIPE